MESVVYETKLQKVAEIRDRIFEAAAPIRDNNSPERRWTPSGILQ
jgi:hypothetical protein